MEAINVDMIGYSDLDGRPPFKMALQEVNGHWFLYCGHLWHRGWTIVDVTNPADLRPIRFVTGPTDTWTCQINVADGLMVTGLQQIPPKWGGRQGVAFEEAAIIWDVRQPTDPVRCAQIRFGGTGSHRNFWAGGRYAQLATNVVGFANNIYVTIDLTDPRAPREVARWWIDGQGPGERIASDEEGLSLHGPAYVVGDRAYLSYGGGGMVILDVSEIERPHIVARYSVSPPFRGGLHGAGVHTVLPLPDRRLAVVNGEAGEEKCREPLSFAGIVDIADETAPRLISTFPVPRPSAGLPYASYCDKGGRFGPHNSHLQQGSPVLEDRDDLVYMTWFNAGLRIYDISDPRLPLEVGAFVPPDPTVRYGPLPVTALVAQSEDVLVDIRGFIYLSDKNQGLYVLRYTGSQ